MGFQIHCGDPNRIIDRYVLGVVYAGSKTLDWDSFWELNLVCMERYSAV